MTVKKGYGNLSNRDINFGW